jgi:hypothetical protein
MKIIGDELKPRGAPNEKIVTIKAYQNSLNPESKNFGRYSEYKKQPVVAMVSEKVYDKKLEKLAKKKNVAISFSYKYFVKEEQTRKEKPCY